MRRALKVYFAAPYGSKPTVEARAAELKALGFVVTSSWLNEPHKPDTQMHELTHAEHRAYAMQDVEDVLAADVMVFATDPTKTITRAGRHVEFGMAVAIGRLIRPMPILVIGEDTENIFHHLPQVHHFAAWESAKGALLRLRDISMLEDE